MINDLILDYVNQNAFPGMTYSIVSNGEVKIGCAGFKQLVPQKKEVAEDTLYDIASLTKVVVVVTIISKLIDRNIINLNDKVQKYLPNFKYGDITVYHLLTHTSGLPADLNSKEIVSRTELLKQVYNLEKQYETGTQVIYSDIGYILLGELIANIYNKPLDVVALEEVFTPLNMLSTGYRPTEKSKCAPTEVTAERGVIQGIVHDEKACSLDGVAGAAGVFTNAIDLSNFLLMVLNDGVYEGKQFLSKKIIDLWFEPLVYEKQNDRYRSLCWIVGKNKLVINQGENIISFTGFTGPSLSIDRERKIGIALLTNRVHPSRDNRLVAQIRPLITEHIYEILLKKAKVNQ